MEEALLAALAANAAVAALVGDRIGWGLRPQGEGLPAICLHLVSAPRTYTLAGRVPTVHRLVQVDCWGGAFDDAKLTARAVQAALDTLTAAPFQGAFLEGERDDSAEREAVRPPGVDADGAEDLFRTSLDVRIVHDDSL
jgi:hypothetical protein